MKKLLETYQTITNHADGPVTTDGTVWQDLIEPIGMDYAALPDLLREYLETALFEKPLSLTFELYSRPYLQKFIKAGDWFSAAAVGDLFIIGNQDGEFVCVSTKHGGVAMVPGWAISEKLFTREKRFKSLETFFRGRIKQEQGAKDSAARAKAKNEAFAKSTNPNAVDSSGYTRLMNVVGDVDAMRAELEAGAKPNIRSKHGKYTALHRAISKKHEPSVKLLLEHGANPDLRTDAKTLRCFWPVSAICWDWCVCSLRVGLIPVSRLGMAIHH